MSLRDLIAMIETGYQQVAWNLQYAEPLDWPLWYFAVILLLIVPLVSWLVAVIGIGSMRLLLDSLRAVGDGVSDLRARFDPDTPPNDPHERYLWANRLGPYSDERDA